MVCAMMNDTNFVQKNLQKLYFYIKNDFLKSFFLKKICTIQSFFVPLHPNFKRMALWIIQKWSNCISSVIVRFVK